MLICLHAKIYVLTYFHFVFEDVLLDPEGCTSSKLPARPDFRKLLNSDMQNKILKNIEYLHRRLDMQHNLVHSHLITTVRVGGLLDFSTLFTSCKYKASQSGIQQNKHTPIKAANVRGREQHLTFHDPPDKAALVHSAVPNVRGWKQHLTFHSPADTRQHLL